MDHEMLVKELQRLQNWLNTHDPTTSEYFDVEERFVKLARLSMEFDEMCDKQLERQDKLELEHQRMEREFEIKEKDLEFKNELEVKKREDISDEADVRRRIERRQAWWDLIKIGLQIGGSAALIIITGNIEQNAILGHNKWSLIPKVKF